MAKPRIVHAVIATFNEEAYLDVCLRSLHAQTGVEVRPIVANAGRPLSPALAEQCFELKIDSSNFWAASQQLGFDEAMRQGAEIILDANADNRFLPEALERLLAAWEKSPDDIFACCGYEPGPDGELVLQFSRDLLVPFFLHNYLKRDWRTLDQAPDRLIPTDMAGQGVLYSAKWLGVARMQYERFPMAPCDHVRWTALRRAGASIYVVGRAALVNERPLSAGKQRGALARAWWYVSSPNAPESVVTQWRYKLAMLPWPVAVLSFLVTTPLKWLYRLAQAAVRAVKR